MQGASYVYEELNSI